MFLPSNKPVKPVKDPTHFNFSVLLHGSFDYNSQQSQATTDYTVRSHVHGLVPRVPEADMLFNPLLLWDMTRSRL
jgi:hypothetical protein